ncbi:MAG: toll/interleukin-1 receptor domain-containing protein [Chlorobaculum sp.]|nr:toll/interleukin-1 receptor domain-containing protein [Chlorobaculum sp.]
MAQDQKDFFISYTGADRQWAEWIAWHLEHAGYSTIIQAWDFRAGGNFILEMHRAAIDSARTIAVLSEKYQQSFYTQPEWAAALVHDPTGKKRLVVPIRIETVEPVGLFAPLIYIDLAGLTEESAKKKLLADIQATMSSEPVRPKTAPNFPGQPGIVQTPAIPQPRFPGTLPPAWNVPLQRNPNFTGREAILTGLHEQFGASTKQIIHGLGGVGKSQIANEFCYRNAGDYEVVWWLRAENASSLATDYASLAGQKALNLPERGEQELEVIINAVRDELNHRNKWPLIFDNACDFESIRSYLPQASSGHVLITTQNPDGRQIGVPRKIETWTRPESIAFLKHRTGQDHDKDAGALADALGDLPLALEQAGAYIENSGISIAKYLELYNTRRAELRKDESAPHDHPESVDVTFTLSIEKAREREPLAVTVLNLCSVVAPDMIPKKLLAACGEHLSQEDGGGLQDELILNRAIAALRKYSLLSVEPEHVSIHRLVQPVAQERVGEEAISRYRGIMLGVLSKQFPTEGYDNPACWPECEQLLAHAEKITEESEPIVETAILLNSMGLYYHGRAFYVKTEPLYRRSLKICEEQLGGEHPNVASSLNNLAALLDDQGKYAEAEPLYRRALKIDEKALGTDHPGVATDLNNLSGLLTTQGKYAEAEALYRRALKICEEQLGGEHPNVASSLNNLAGLLREQGKYAEAEPLYRRSLNIREEQLGTDHPGVATDLNNLAGLLRAQGKYAEAEPLYRRAVQICERSLGESHPNTITMKNNLAVLREIMNKG